MLHSDDNFVRVLCCSLSFCHSLQPCCKAVPFVVKAAPPKCCCVALRLWCAWRLFVWCWRIKKGKP